MKIIEKDNEFILHVKFVDVINKSQFFELDTTVFKFESEGIFGLPDIPISGDNAFYNHEGNWVKALEFDHISGTVKIESELLNTESIATLINEVAENLQAEIKEDANDS